MKLYKVTTISDFNVREVFTVHADSKREAIMKAYDTNMDGNIGFNTNVNRLNAGLRQGVYPFGCAIKLNEYVYEIYSTLLDKWIAERSERT